MQFRFAVNVPIPTSLNPLLAPPKSYAPEATTLWSFPNRGTWAGHSGTYRGNWSPYVPRNLIERYSSPGDTVLDPMVGGGTSIIEAALLGRHSIAVDVNPAALEMSADRLASVRAAVPGAESATSHQFFLGDARALKGLSDESVNLALAHPPYAWMIRYSETIPEDLSNCQTRQTFGIEMQQVAKECFRVLKPGSHCAVLIGDSRKNGHVVPLSWELFSAFLGAGFVIREHIVKAQWNVSSERDKWTAARYPFYKIAHENLFVFRKPCGDEDRRVTANSAVAVSAAGGRLGSSNREEGQGI